MNCALRQNHRGGGDGPRMFWSFEGEQPAWGGAKLISELAPAPHPNTCLYEVITGPSTLLLGKAGDFYGDQSPQSQQQQL